MFDAITRLSVPSSSMRVHPARPAAGFAAPGEARSRTQAEAAHAPPVAPLLSGPPPPAGGAAPRAATQPGAAPRVRPAWPDPATVNLASELLALSTTTIAHTATLSLPETGADFWSLLATALPEGERE